LTNALVSVADMRDGELAMRYAACRFVAQRVLSREIDEKGLLSAADGRFSESEVRAAINHLRALEAITANRDGVLRVREEFGLPDHGWLRSTAVLVNMQRKGIPIERLPIQWKSWESEGGQVDWSLPIEVLTGCSELIQDKPLVGVSRTEFLAIWQVARAAAANARPPRHRVVLIGHSRAFADDVVIGQWEKDGSVGPLTWQEIDLPAEVGRVIGRLVSERMSESQLAACLGVPSRRVTLASRWEGPLCAMWSHVHPESAYWQAMYWLLQQVEVA
jgi:hypothetical protein